MKKILGSLLVVAMICFASMSVAAGGAAVFDAEAAPRLGEATITISKTWDDAGYESSRPESVTVNVGDQTVTLTAEGDWQASVIVDSFEDDGSLSSYAISENNVEGYTSVVDPETVMMNGFVSDNNFVPVRSCNTTTKYFDQQNIGIFKKGGSFIIWTDKELTDGAKIALVELIESYGIDDLLDLGTPDFVFGNLMFDLNGQDVTITEDGFIQFEGRSTWSWFYNGNAVMAQNVYPVNVTNTIIPQYVWEQYGGDTGTGYDPNGLINEDDNWFMYNTVNTADWEIGAFETFNIQAGQWKNGTNFVGTYTVTKVADSEYQISYSINTEYFANMENPNDYKIEFNNIKLWVNDTGTFQTSPGNQDGLATEVFADESFSFTGDTLDVYAHFDVSYWNLVPIV